MQLPNKTFKEDFILVVVEQHVNKTLWVPCLTCTCILALLHSTCIYMYIRICTFGHLVHVYTCTCIYVYLPPLWLRQKRNVVTGKLLAILFSGHTLYPMVLLLTPYINCTHVMHAMYTYMYVYIYIYIQCTYNCLQALGCLLYKLCYQEHPFEDSAKLRILSANYKLPAEDTPYVLFHDIISESL